MVAKFQSTKQRIVIISAIVLGIALVAGLVYLLISSRTDNIKGSLTEDTSLNDTSMQASVISGEIRSVSLTEGKNKITSGGVYSVSGNVTNGKITIDTDDDVKLILNSVSIVNPDGAAIKHAGSGLVVIELIGDNVLKATGQEDPAAAISSDGSLELYGEGSVKITSTGKGIKAENTLKLISGTYDITAADDTIHTNGSLAIAGGAYALDTGDDGIHADVALTISGGKFVINAHEGLEAVTITISGGDFDITTDDDGINATNSNGSSMPGRSGDGSLNISGGTIRVNSAGDGLDSNGSMVISGGTIYIDGATSFGDSAIDGDGSIEITGGTLIALGTSGMAQNATSATQGSALINLSKSYPAGTKISIGNISYTAKKSFNSILVSSPELKANQSYSLSLNNQTVETIEIPSNYIYGTSNGMGGFGGGRGDKGNRNMPERR